MIAPVLMLAIALAMLTWVIAYSLGRRRGYRDGCDDGYAAGVTSMLQARHARHSRSATATIPQRVPGDRDSETGRTFPWCGPSDGGVAPLPATSGRGRSNGRGRGGRES